MAFCVASFDRFSSRPSQIGGEYLMILLGENLSYYTSFSYLVFTEDGVVQLLLYTVIL